MPRHPGLSVRVAYAGLLCWPWAWYLLLTPTPGQRPWLAPLLVTLVLAPPAAGVFRLRHAALQWGGFAAILAFLYGVMEAWTVPGDRLPACVFIALSLAYLASLGLFSRRR